MSSQPSSACLGLTCRKLYSCFKKIYPHYIYLGSADCLVPGCHEVYQESSSTWIRSQSCSCYDWGRRCWTRGPQLWQLLETWMGPSHKIASVNIEGVIIFTFARLSIYGDQIDMSVANPSFSRTDTLRGPLRDRYRDWAKASSPVYKNVRFYSRLPNPCNKGDSWYPEAISAIKADVARWKDVRAWRQFWARCDVFGSNEDIFDEFVEKACLERLDEEMGDGLRLLGL